MRDDFSAREGKGAERKGGGKQETATHKDTAKEATDDHTADQAAHDGRDARRAGCGRCEVGGERHENLRRDAGDADEEAESFEDFEVGCEGLPEGEEGCENDQAEEKRSSRKEVAKGRNQDEAADALDGGELKSLMRRTENHRTHPTR